MKKRESWIDVIKGICILMVIIHHTDLDRFSGSLLFPFWIYMAVPCFMILSGYTMALTYNQWGGRPSEN